MLVTDHDEFKEIISKFESAGVDINIIQKTRIRKSSFGLNLSPEQVLVDNQLSASELNMRLSELQWRRIKKAFERGYFDIPSKTNLKQLACEEGVSRSTFSECLKKAQKKLLGSTIRNMEKTKSNSHLMDKDETMLIKLRIQR